jgi:single-stranded DNA-binding protein
MIDALIAGKLYGAPKRGSGKNGNPFTTLLVRATAGNGESLMVSVIVFDDTAQTALQALGEGDSVALAGTLTPKVYEARDGSTRPALDLVAHAVLTAYHVKHKRQAVQDAEQ